MSEAEVICISSDDDDEEPKQKKNNNRNTKASRLQSTKDEVKKFVCPKADEVRRSNDNNISTPKRKENQDAIDNANIPPAKKFKVSMEQRNANKVQSTKTPKPSCSNVKLHNNVQSTESATPSCSNGKSHYNNVQSIETATPSCSNRKTHNNNVQYMDDATPSCSNGKTRNNNVQYMDDATPSCSNGKTHNNNVQYMDDATPSCSNGKTHNNVQYMDDATPSCSNGRSHDNNIQYMDDATPSCSNGRSHGNDFTLPSLVVKEKKTISEDEQNALSMFLNVCRENDRGNDMQKIIDRIVQKYEQLDDEYKKSRAFDRFLTDRRFAMMNEKNRTYRYINEVIEQMKERINGTSVLLSSFETPDVNDNDSEEDHSDNEVKKRRIKQLDKAMRKAEAKIKDLETMESELDDENSTYIQVDRYKKRIVQLFNMRCQTTGDSIDAGRSYLKPKRLKPSRIPEIDQAITKLVNKNISKRHKLKKDGTGVDSLIFPNYSDILECIRKCNDTHNMGFTSSKQEQVAKDAFTELGEHLQRVRQRDYWDTFSLHPASREEDPAKSDPVLAAKLAESQREGRKRLATIFDKYADEQEKLKNQPVEAEEENDTEEDIETEESDDEDEDDLETDGFSEAESEDNPRPSTSNSNNRENECSNKENSDCKETDDEVKTTIAPNPTSNSTTTAEPETSSKSNDELSNSDAVKRNNENVEDPTKQTNTSNQLTPDALTITDSSTNVPISTPTPSTVPRRVSEEKSKPDGQTDEVVNSTQNNVIFDELELCETENEEEQECENEENTRNIDTKPLLRLRSFAKPPTTWNDGENRQGGSPVRPKATNSKVDGSPVRPKATNSRMEGSPVVPKATNSRVEGSPVRPKATSSKMEGSSEHPKPTSSRVERSLLRPKATSSKVQVSLLCPKATNSRVEASLVRPKATSSRVEGSPVRPKATSSRVDGSPVRPIATSSRVEGSPVRPKATSSKTNGSSVHQKVSNSNVEFVDLTLSPAKSTIANECRPSKTIPIAPKLSNNNNGEHDTTDIIQVLKPSNIQVLNNGLHITGTSVRIAKPLNSVTMVNIEYTNRNGHHSQVSAPVKRIQPQNITALRPSASSSKSTGRQK